MKITEEQPSQPPKQAVYLQLSNPVTHTPEEQRIPPPKHRYGEAVSSISHRTADSRPSTDEAIAKIQARHRHQLKEMQAADVDTEYGVELQPREGEIAAAVRGHSRRAQGGTHVDPIYHSQNSGSSTYGEEPDLVANMERKMQEHRHKLESRSHQRAPMPDGETAEREALRERRLKQDQELHVQQAVHEATGDPVVG